MSLAALDAKVDNWGDFANLSEDELTQLFESMGMGPEPFDRNAIKQQMLAQMSAEGAPPEARRQLLSMLDPMINQMEALVGGAGQNIPRQIAREFKQIYAANCCGEAQFIAALGAAETKVANQFRDRMSRSMGSMAGQNGMPPGAVDAMIGQMGGGTTNITYSANDPIVTTARNMIGNGGQTQVSQNTPDPSNTSPGSDRRGSPGIRGNQPPGGNTNQNPPAPPPVGNTNTQVVPPPPPPPGGNVNTQVVPPPPPPGGNINPQVVPIPPPPPGGNPNPAVVNTQPPGQLPPMPNPPTWLDPPALPDPTVTTSVEPTEPNRNVRPSPPGGEGRDRVPPPIFERVKNKVTTEFRSFVVWLRESMAVDEDAHRSRETLVHGAMPGWMQGRYGVKIVPQTIGPDGVIRGTNIGGGLVN